MIKIYFLILLGSCLFSSPIDNNISYQKYLNLIIDIEESTKNYYDAEMKYHYPLSEKETKEYQDGNYSELYYDKRYVSLVKSPYIYLSYAKKALHDKNFKYSSMILDTLQCLKSDDYIKLGYELYKDYPNVDKEVLNTYIGFGGEWGLNIQNNYKSNKKIKKLLDFILDKNISENITWTIKNLIQNGVFKDQQVYYFLTKVRYAIENKSDNNITWYPYSFCTDENTEKYPMPIITNWH